MVRTAGHAQAPLAAQPALASPTQEG